MRLLLDTNALLWWFQEHPSLSSKARRVLSSTSNEIFVSTAVGWELSIKSSSGKLEIDGLLDGFERKVQEQGMTTLPITMNHAIRAGRLPVYHKDPFDRMLVAQAQLEDFPIISSDSIFERYGVRRTW